MTPTTDQRIAQLVAHAYEHAAAVRRMMDEAGLQPADVQGAADLPKMPIIEKDDLIAMQAAEPPFGGLLAVAADSLPRIYISPGPIYDPQPPNPDGGDPTLAAVKRVGLGAGDRVLNTFMYHLTPAGLLIDRALLAAGCTVIPGGPGNSELLVKMIHDLKITGYVGTPSFLAILLDKMADMGITKAAIPLRKALFSAEPYLPAQRARFEGEYGMTTISAYGTADLGIIGYSAAGVQGFCLVDSIYMEIVEPDSGQPLEAGAVGQIVVTLFNKSYPLIRFGTGDLGALAAQADAPCGAGQQLLGLFGRSGDAIKVRGMFLHPNQVLAAVGRVAAVRHAQAIITRPENRDVVTLRVELHTEEAQADVADALMNHLQAVARLRVDAVEVVEAGVIDPAERVVRDDRRWD